MTGAAGHLGGAITEALASLGARVAALDSRPDPGGRGAELSVTCDLLDLDSATAAIDEVAGAIGPVSILVNAAGLIHSAALVDISAPASSRPDLATFRRVVDANLTSAWLATSLVVRRMVASRTKGVVVSLSSVAAQGNAGQAAYAAAKAGLNAMTASWAKELGPLGIRFVAVAPGFIDTPSTHEAMTETALEDWARRTPTRSLGTGEDVASAVIFAIENRHTTGTVLKVDGGLTL